MSDGPRKVSPLTKLVLAYSLHTPPHRGKWLIVSAAVSLFHLDPRGQFIDTRAGLKWALDPGDHIEKDLFWLGVKDVWDIYHLEQVFRPGDTFIDAGANFGYYSILLTNKLGPTSRAYAFEPNPATYDRLSKNIHINSITNVFPQQLGLSDHAGTAGLLNRPGNSGASALVEGDGGVSTTTLDEFCLEQQITSIAAIKVDVEGFEEKFLKGAAVSLNRFKPAILIELNPVTLPLAGSSIPQVVSLLRSHGYQLFEMHREKLVELTSLPAGQEHVNVLCLHPDRTAAAV